MISITLRRALLCGSILATPLLAAELMYANRERRAQNDTRMKTTVQSTRFNTRLSPLQTGRRVFLFAFTGNHETDGAKRLT